MKNRLKIYNMQRVVLRVMAMVGIVVMTMLAVGCGDGAGERVVSNAYIQTPEVKGESRNCAVVLRAQQGISYTMTIESEGNWATFSGGKGSVTAEMEASDKVVYIYFTKNASGMSREASVDVRFTDGAAFSLNFCQHSYDDTIAVQHTWPELPVCPVDDNYIYNTHYGKLGVRSDARNYTYCFDIRNRASIWVAYPLHRDHMSGSGNRNNSSFGYDPDVEDNLQAALGLGSYNGWYDRGHQLPAADRKCSQQMMDQTFYSTNMTPQQYRFNQNKWGVLEGRVRNMTCNDTLYVVTGAYFGGQHHSSIDASTTDRKGNRCPTPTHYFKALLRTKSGNTGRRIDEITSANQLRAIAFWFEHENTGDDTTITAADCISIEELEALTGIEFFPIIDDSIEAEVKATAVPSEWGVN